MKSQSAIFITTFVIILLNYISPAHSVDLVERTSRLDDHDLRIFYHTFRNFIFNQIGRTGRRTKGVFLQEKFPNNMRFPCNITTGKSKEVPTSIHKLRPGDINVIAAMGDSLTAATGASATKFADLSMENRGLAWSIGGQWNWRNVTTLPNILKVFNPKLVGYSYGDSFPFHKDAQFNIAEIGAVSSDLPFMAKALIARIRADPRVDFKKDWKMITLSIGGNDICSFVCAMEKPETLPQKHKLNLYRALTYIRDNMPRTFVNIVSVPSVKKVVFMKDKPQNCRVLHHGECSCWVGSLYNQSNDSRRRWSRIQQEFIRVEEEVAKMSEFRGLDSFAVVLQPWSKKASFKLNGKTDYTVLAFDCFHMSQKGNAYAGTALWNNLLEPEGKKSLTWMPLKDKFLCPTEEHPYIYTYDNS